MNKRKYYIELYRDTLMEQIIELPVKEISDDYKLPDDADCIVIKKETLYENDIKMIDTELIMFNKEKYQLITSVDQKNIKYIYSRKNKQVLNCSNTMHKQLETHEDLEKYFNVAIEIYKDSEENQKTKTKIR